MQEDASLVSGRAGTKEASDRKAFFRWGTASRGGWSRVFRQLQELQGGRGNLRHCTQVSRCGRARAPCAPAKSWASVLSSVTVAALGAIGFCRGDSGETRMWRRAALPASLCPRTPPGVWCAEFTLQQIRGRPCNSGGAGVYPSVGNQSCALNVTLCIVWRVVERKSVIELLQWWIQLLEKS